MTQLELDIAPVPEFLVGCRVQGTIQHYRVQAMDCEKARMDVAMALPRASPVLALVKGGKK